MLWKEPLPSAATSGQEVTAGGSPCKKTKEVTAQDGEPAHWTRKKAQSLNEWTTIFLSSLPHWNLVQHTNSTQCRVNRQSAGQNHVWLQEVRQKCLSTQPVVPEPKDFTMVLTLAPKLLEAIFFPGTWKGFETASTYAAWNFLKNCANGDGNSYTNLLPT